MTKNQKIGTTIGTIVGIIVVTFVIQLGRFYSATKDLINGTSAVLPINYFPFNGTYDKQNDKLTKA